MNKLKLIDKLNEYYGNQGLAIRKDSNGRYYTVRKEFTEWI